MKFTKTFALKLILLPDKIQEKLNSIRQVNTQENTRDQLLHDDLLMNINDPRLADVNKFELIFALLLKNDIRATIACLSFTVICYIACLTLDFSIRLDNTSQTVVNQSNESSLTAFLFMNFFACLLNYYAYLLDVNERSKLKLSFGKIYWHTYKSIIRLILQTTFLASYLINLVIIYAYSDFRDIIWKSQNFIRIAFLELYFLLSIIKTIFFFFKALVNTFLFTFFLTAPFIGMYEDKMCMKLNKLINTRTKIMIKRIEPFAPIPRITKEEAENIQELLSTRSSLEQTCSICLCDIVVNEIISTLPCSNKHTFHTTCLESWFSNNVCCPICRTNFNNLFEVEERNNGDQENMREMNILRDRLI